MICSNYSSVKILSVFAAVSVIGSTAVADSAADLAAQNVHLLGNCNIALEGSLIIDGECYFTRQMEMGNEIMYIYDKPEVADEGLRFEDMVVLYYSGDENVVKVAYENGDGIHYLMGDFAYDGECYASERGRICTYSWEAAD